MFPKTSKISLFQTTANIIVGAVLWLILLPGFVVVLLPSFVLRWAHHIFARIFRPDLIPSSGFEDALFGIQPLVKHSNMNTTQIWRMRGKLNINLVRAHFETLFLSTPELRRKYRNLYCHMVRWGLYIFKKAVPENELNLKSLIAEYNGPQLEDDLELEAFIGKWLDTNYRKENEPTWQILVIYLPKVNESIFLYKTDHGVNDGYTFVHFVQKFSGIEAPYLVKDDDISFTRKLKIILSTPKIILDYCFFLKMSKQMPYPDNIGSNYASENELSLACCTLDLDLIKEIRRATSSHFNTVLGEIEAGALRQYCLDKLIETKGISEKEAKSFLPKECWIPSPAAKPHHPAMILGGMANHLTVTCMKFQMREESPLKRLMAGEESFLRCEDAGIPKIVEWILGPLIIYPLPSVLIPWIMKILQISGLLSSVQQCLTPLMLSPRKHTFLGLQVDHIYLPVQGPVAIPSIHVTMVPVSNGGQLDITVNGTRKIFKDQRELDNFTKIYLKAELDCLVKAVLNK